MRAARSLRAAELPRYKFSVSTSANYPPLPEGMTLDASTGAISSAIIGGQGTYVAGNRCDRFTERASNAAN